MVVNPEKLRKKLLEEIHYYRSQNENLKKEISYLEETLDNNKTRLDIISSDYEDSQEMLRIMKLLTR